MKKKEIGLWNGPQLARGLNWYKVVHPNSKWAERYNSHFEKAISFLDKSKNRRSAINALIGLIIIAISAGISYSYINITIAKNDALKSEQDALKQRAVALSNDSARKVALDSSIVAAQRALRSDSIAKAERDSAIRADSATKVALAEANHQKILADTATNKATRYAKKNAVALYQKLIRESPIEKNLIYRDTTDFKLLAYDHHLSILNAPRKDDELYEKLYYSLKCGQNFKYAIDYTKTKLSDTIYLGNNGSLYYKGKFLYVTAGARKDSVEFDNSITSISANPASRKMFVATTGKDINIYNYNPSFETQIENKIVLGGVITAIDYFIEQHTSIIFFGLETGETGYINYSNKSQRKYEPVYRNDLEWRVTAIDFFKRKTDNAYYLLATNSKGKAVVYESDTSRKTAKSYLNPDIKLIEVTLPDNYGPIKNAKYDEATDHILFRTSRFNYTWNPFTEQLLAELNTELTNSKRANLDSVIVHTKKY